MRALVLQGGERKRFVLAVGLAFGAVAAACALLVTSGYLISRAAERPPVLLLTAAIVTVRALALARAGLRYGERLSGHDVALRVLTRVRVSFYQRLAPLVPGDLRGRDRGRLLSGFVHDVDTLQDFYPRGVTPVAVAVLAALGAGITAAIFVPVAGPLLAGALILGALVAFGLTAWLTAIHAEAEAGARSELTSRLVEALDGGAELAVAGRAPEQVAAIDAGGARLAKLQRRHAVGSALATAAFGLVAAAGLLVTLIVGIDAVHDGRLSGVLLAGMAFLALVAFEGIAPIGPAARHLRACAVAVERLDDVCAPSPSVTDPELPRTLPADGALEAENVWLRYAVDDPWALCGVNLSVEPGEHVAIAGPSGAGKTTLAHLLVRFRDPDEGRVTIGGVDLRNASQSDVRATVALVDQDAHLFATSVRENIRLARPDASDARIEEALARAGLADWLAALPEGLDTLVAEDGATVSGGERQRIALARGLVTDATFLVVDEPTAHLDRATADQVIADLLRAAHGRGLLVITHVRSGLEAFDRVAELADGKAVTAEHD